MEGPRAPHSQARESYTEVHGCQVMVFTLPDAKVAELCDRVGRKDFPKLIYILHGMYVKCSLRNCISLLKHCSQTKCRKTELSGHAEEQGSMKGVRHYSSGSAPRNQRGLEAQQPGCVLLPSISHCTSPVEQILQGC